MLIEKKEQISRLLQTAPLKTKLIFSLYKFMLGMRNKFMFMNVLSLYDYICQRNKELVINPTIKLKDYLSGDWTLINSNIFTIEKIYKSYSDEVIKTKARKFNKNKIMEKKRNILKSIRENSLLKKTAGRKRRLSIGSGLSRNTRKRRGSVINADLYKVKDKRRGSNVSQTMSKMKMESNISEKEESEEFSPSPLDHFHNPDKLLERYKKYDFKVVKLDTDNRHRFYKLLVNDELNTKGFSQFKTRVFLYLLGQVIVSNWHNFCYISFAIYCFVNGGFSGFLYMFLMVVFVFIEENFPSLLYWRMTFFIATSSLMLKLIFIQIRGNSGNAQSGNGQSQANGSLQLEYTYLGNSTHVIDCIILIMILIQLALLDEMGLKEKKVSQFEDTSTAFVRMRLNKIFEIRYQQNFQMHELYLKALYQASQNLALMLSSGKAGKLSNGVSGRKRLLDPSFSQIMRSKKRRGGVRSLLAPTMIPPHDKEKELDEKLNDEIDFNGIIQMEKAERDELFKDFRKTYRDIDSIFLKSFSRITEKRKKSFFWQNFSIYNRKPGKDLSPLLNLSLLIWTVYTTFFINTMQGESKSFIDQAYVSNSISISIIFSLMMGISFMIMERIIYKKNPKEWRRQLALENASKKPQTLEQLQAGIRHLIKKGHKPEEITWDKIEIAPEEKKKKKKKTMALAIEEEKKRKQDTEYRSNPLLFRYFYQMLFLLVMIITSWLYFPSVANFAKYSSLFCVMKPNDFNFSKTECAFFQKKILIQIFFAISLLYVFLSALQIRFGEPINKGKRVLMSEVSPIYYGANLAIRKSPFFFSIASMLDFMLTPTALDFFEWVKFESIYFALYVDINKMRSRDQRIPGMRIRTLFKLPYGIIGTLLQVVILLLPFLAAMSAFSQLNHVGNIKLDIDLVVKQNSINLYKSEFLKSTESIGNQLACNVT